MTKDVTTSLRELVEKALETYPLPWTYQEKSDAYTHIVRTDGGRFIAQFGQSTKGDHEALARLRERSPRQTKELC